MHFLARNPSQSMSHEETGRLTYDMGLSEYVSAED